MARWRLLTKGKKGANVWLGSRISLTPGCEIEVGDRVRIENDCVLEISVVPKASVTIGPGTWISHHCHICSYERISMGSHVLIGEFVSIRDSSHSYDDPQKPMKLQKDRLGTITIADDVWIGRGVIIMGKPEGVTIGKGAIIAANSVVNHSIPPMEIWGGVPCRFIKSRPNF
jgi:acetyltransferase-like isoleucine patch superfamily enzyme